MLCCLPRVGPSQIFSLPFGCCSSRRWGGEARRQRSLTSVPPPPSRAGSGLQAAGSLPSSPPVGGRNSCFSGASFCLELGPCRSGQLQEAWSGGWWGGAGGPPGQCALWLEPLSPPSSPFPKGGRSLTPWESHCRSTSFPALPLEPPQPPQAASIPLAFVPRRRDPQEF